MNFDSINDNGLAQLAPLTNLERLDLMQTNVRGTGFDQLKGLTRLTHIDGRYVPFTNQGLASLAALPALEHLNLHGAKNFSDSGLKAFRDRKTLRFLSVSETGVTDAAVPLLATLTGLQDLYIERTKITPAGVAKLRAALPSCRIHLN